MATDPSLAPLDALPQVGWMASPSPPREKRLLPVLLLGLTCLTTLAAGFFLDLGFSGSAAAAERLGRLVTRPWEILSGWPFAVSILAFLLAHELGHYLTCRHYGIRATLPYLLPAPPLVVPFGTFGALIRIKSLFLDRRQLFDVGIAGPLAGFVVIVPILVIGIALSVDYVPPEEPGLSLEVGEPLLFQLAVRLFFPGTGPDINLHPVGWAAWFGMLATSLNLLPIGQLDGGHVVYALFGERGHRLISVAVFVMLVMLGLSAWPMLTYLLFAVVVLVVMRFRHPPPLLGEGSLGRVRIWLAVVAAVIFVLTFIPVPVRLVEHVGRL